MDTYKRNLMLLNLYMIPNFNNNLCTMTFDRLLTAQCPISDKLQLLTSLWLSQTRKMAEDENIKTCPNSVRITFCLIRRFHLIDFKMPSDAALFLGGTIIDKMKNKHEESWLRYTHKLQYNTLNQYWKFFFFTNIIIVIQ